MKKSQLKDLIKEQVRLVIKEAQEGTDTLHVTIKHLQRNTENIKQVINTHFGINTNLLVPKN